MIGTRGKAGAASAPPLPPRRAHRARCPRCRTGAPSKPGTRRQRQCSPVSFLSTRLLSSSLHSPLLFSPIHSSPVFFSPLSSSLLSLHSLRCAWWDSSKSTASRLSRAEHTHPFCFFQWERATRNEGRGGFGKSGGAQPTRRPRTRNWSKSSFPAMLSPAPSARLSFCCSPLYL